MDEINGKFYLSVTAVVRVTLSIGTFHEDVGLGSSEGHRNMALEKAKKEAVTDALKRALRQYGNALGNSLYDREFLREIKYIKKEKRSALDVSELLRKPVVKNEGRKISLKKEDLDDIMKGGK